MENYEKDWSRRRFIKTIAGTGALFMLSPLQAWTVEDIDPRVAALIAKTLGIDTHNHVDVPLTTEELPGPNLDLSGEMRRSGLAAICMTFAVDYQKLNNPGDAYTRFINGLDAMDKVLAANNMKRAMNLAELEAAHKQQQPIVIQSVEGCHFLEGKLERLETAYNRGLRHVGLLHDNDASVPLGDVYTNPAQYNGLTTFGAQVIKECNRLGMLVDLAHASNTTLDAALKLTTQPVLISHTGLDTQLGKNDMMAKMMRPRLISKKQAKIVADAGGVIGVWTHLADTPLEYAQNIRAMVDVTGIDHVCIGTDTKMTPAYRPAGGFGNKPGPPQQGQPHNGPGEHKNGGDDKGRKRAGERTNEAWADEQAGFYFVVVDALLKTGFTESEIAKIGGGNFCRVFNAATSGHK